MTIAQPMRVAQRGGAQEAHSPPPPARPPSSTTNTTRRQRRERLSSRYVCRRLRLAALRKAMPGTTSARGRGALSRATGPTMVASSATCEPCQSGSPLQTTSMRRASWTGTWTFIAASLTFRPTRAPASWQTRTWREPFGGPCAWRALSIARQHT